MHFLLLVFEVLVPELVLCGAPTADEETDPQETRRCQGLMAPGAEEASRPGLIVTAPSLSPPVSF